MRRRDGDVTNGKRCYVCGYFDVVAGMGHIPVRPQLRQRREPLIVIDVNNSLGSVIGDKFCETQDGVDSAAPPMQPIRRIPDDWRIPGNGGTLTISLYIVEDRRIGYVKKWEWCVIEACFVVRRRSGRCDRERRDFDGQTVTVEDQHGVHSAPDRNPGQAQYRLGGSTGSQGRVRRSHIGSVLTRPEYSAKPEEMALQLPSLRP